MYSCPKPLVILDGLLDVFLFFRDLPAPNGGSCLVADAEETDLVRLTVKHRPDG